MARDTRQNEAYWNMMKETQIKKEYAEWLEEEGRTNDSDAAHIFAIQKIAGGFDYMGIKERDLILLLAGQLPYMYD